MSSGTQVDLDWAGTESPSPSGGYGGHEASTAGGAPGDTGAPDASTTRYLTDEEILGIEPVGKVPNRRDVILSEAKNLSSIDDAGTTRARRDSSDKNSTQNDTVRGTAATPAGQPASATMPAWMQAIADDPNHEAEAKQLWQEHQAFRAAFSSPEEARTMKEMFPGGPREAATLRQASQSVDRIDAAIFSGDVRAQSQVVAELAQANPAAFRSLFAEAAKVLGVSQASLSVRDGAARDGVQDQNQTAQFPNAAGAARATSNVVDASLNASRFDEQAKMPGVQFDPAAYASFERSTNEVVARDVRGSISETLTRVLPEGIADGAARRIGEDIFNEVHRSLAADRSLSEQVGEVLRDRRFGSAEQQRVSSLLAGRARQLVPSVARRVIGEWTSSVLGTARTKAARQAAAASRVDIAAAGGSLDSMPLRQMSPREVNYASMSDDEILAM